MKKLIDIISAVPSFSGLPESQLREIKNISVDRHFNKGEIIFSDGDDGTGFFVVVEGLVKIFKVSSEGKEQILHIYGPGEPFGQVAVYAGRSYPANAQAIAKSHVLFFPRSAFVELLTANPSLALNMLAVLSMRLREFTVQVENLSLKEVPGRLAGYLIYLADEQGKEDVVTLYISKGQLASLLGTIPETLSRIFARMTELNLIELDGRTIKLLNRDKLEELAEYGRMGGNRG
ncbi:MAG: Crp/Fnr family transcriptional regulator [Desulfobacteraceae bacterium]|nr:MAG: Crp/Fnr family transcriptional regulator [Desulfobacteraceae bacterium]